MQVDPADFAALTPDEQRELDQLLREGAPPKLWSPLPGPQRLAFDSTASVIGFGGAAGGGKTDLAIGLALTQHQRVGIFRQNGTELTAIVDRIAELLGTRDGWDRHGILRTKRPDGNPVQIELGSFPNTGDEAKYRGRPRDLLVLDEAAEMREAAVRFLTGWVRTVDSNQRVRTLLCFNPPTSVEGRWIIEFFAPWLDRKHPRPAGPGEVRWFAMVDGKEREVGAEPFMHNGELIYPTSRTFIPSRIKDNPHLMRTGYYQQLQSLPEPLRSQLIYGDFQAGVKDDPYQVIPTAWVEAAQARWTKPAKLAPMDSVGVDVALGGDDNTVIARRHDMWFDEPLVYAGKDCKDGPTIAGFVIAAARDGAVQHVDLFGVGAQPYAHLLASNQHVLGVAMAAEPQGTALQGGLRFLNRRTELWWRMREALDPGLNSGICLPPDKRVLADLTAVRWKLAGRVIVVEPRDEIVKRIGRSVDVGTAYVLGLIHTVKHRAVPSGTRRTLPGGEWDPYANL